MDQCDINLLANLLNPKGSEDNDEERGEVVKPETKNPYRKVDEEVAEVKKEDISTRKAADDQYDGFYYDENGEVAMTSSENTQKHWKAAPKFDISYRQAVTSSDVFLQMGGKNPSTASCENMILKISLPGESRQNIDLKVLKHQIILHSPKFYLNFPLPQPVDPQRGNAQFDNDAEQLIVTLVMDREFDFINF